MKLDYNWIMKDPAYFYRLFQNYGNKFQHKYSPANVWLPIISEKLSMNPNVFSKSIQWRRSRKAADPKAADLG